MNTINRQAIIEFTQRSDFGSVSEKCIEVADAAVTGQWVFDLFSKNITQFIDFDINDIDWDVQATKQPNSFSLSLHALITVYCLASAYHITGTEQYLNRAVSIVESWEVYLKKMPDNLNRYTWYDHAVACRARILVYLETVCDLSGKPINRFKELIQTHANWLLDDENYTQKHNHGIMQDMALVTTGYYLDDDNYVKKGIDRLIKQFQHAFPNKYAHTENSIGYNVAILRFVFSCYDFLAAIGSDKADEIDQYKEGACIFLTHATMPNTKFPITGDTLRAIPGKSTTNTLVPLIKPYVGKGSLVFDNLYWAISMGQAGLPPSDLHKVFCHDGYAFWRSGWEALEGWIMLRSGFLSTTHKHRDDLSINFATKGVEVFIDPGMYNYMVGNVNHDYLNSTFAHSGVIVNNSSYPLGRNLTSKAGILDTSPSPDFCAVQAYNNLYHGVFIDRTIYYVNPGEFYIVDDIISQDAHAYQQNFHLSNEVSLSVHERGHSVIKITGTPWNVCITQHQPCDAVTIKQGETGDLATMSVMSAGPSQVLPTTSIQYEKKGASTRFITRVSTVEDSMIEDIIHKPIIVSGDYLTIGEETVDITPRQRALPASIEVKVEDGALNVTCEENHTKGMTSAYYLMAMESGKVVETTEYSHGPTTNIKLPEPGDYILQAYTRAKGRETIVYYAGGLSVRDDQSISFFKTPIDQSIPYIQERSFTGNNNKYNFTLKHQVPWDCVVGWYVYRNGASYEHISGKSQLNFTFTEPGTYTVMYRFKVRYFYEVEFGNFPEITITSQQIKTEAETETAAPISQAMEDRVSKILGPSGNPARANRTAPQTRKARPKQLKTRPVKKRSLLERLLGIK